MLAEIAIAIQSIIITRRQFFSFSPTATTVAAAFSNWTLSGRQNGFLFQKYKRASYVFGADTSALADSFFTNKKLSGRSFVSQHTVSQFILNSLKNLRSKSVGICAVRKYAFPILASRYFGEAEEK